MKKLSLCFALICFISFRVAADCYMFLGGNYSATLKTGGAPVHAGGVNYSVLFDWGRFRGLYLGASVVLGADNHAPQTPYSFDFTGYSAVVSGLGFRVGYPFNFDVSDGLRLSVIPAIAVDFTGVNGKCGNTKVIGNGERVGLVLGLSATHKLGAVYLRYGVEGEACAVSAMNYSYKTRYTLPDGDVTAFEEWSLVPFVSLGWRVGR
jgi:hypothetical protein